MKNGLKVKQLAKQPPTLKTLIQETLFELSVTKFTFSILSSLKLNFTTNFSTKFLHSGIQSSPLLLIKVQIEVKGLYEEVEIKI